ncbi:hypothetical protein [Xylanibacillus composti]|uniref:hypothetical protein n=1 Tax=Xylanibacillus composti TaxID=1572762 RepID=UPI001BCF9E4A|nr:hypothetical protein [Xylanibacillus composti]
MRSVIFTGGQTHADWITFKKNDLNEIIRWAELETGLIHGDNFRLNTYTETEYVFQASYEGIPLSPSGEISIKLDDAGRLVFFAMYGQFPAGSMIRGEAYALSLDRDMEKLAYEQIKLVQFPIVEEKRWLAVYALEEIYITNDKQTLIPFTMDARMDRQVNQVMEWDTPLDGKFEEQPLCFQRKDLTLEQALSLCDEPNRPFWSDQDQAIILKNVLDFLRKEFPEDSGKWLLKRIFREEPYILAELDPFPEENRVPQRKLRVFLEESSFEVVHYMDKAPFLQMFENYASPDQAVVTKEQAFEQLKGKLELTPAYVYDGAQQAYRLCGKLDCRYGVLVNGDGVVALSEL